LIFKKKLAAFLLTFLSFAILGNTVKCKVLYVCDGDTFKCRLENGKEVRVRLIGIDTSETSENRRAVLQTERLGSIEKVSGLGIRAKEYVEEILYTFDVIHLEFDVQRTDKYGRVLAYVRVDAHLWVSGGNGFKLYNLLYLKYLYNVHNISQVSKR